MTVYSCSPWDRSLTWRAARVCGVIAWVHARELVTLIDAPLVGRAVRLAWNKRRYACHEPACTMATFVEQDDTVTAPRALLTARAVSWALAQLCAEHASISALARQLGVDWNTVWRALKTRLECLDTDPRGVLGHRPTPFRGSSRTRV